MKLFHNKMINSIARYLFIKVDSTPNPNYMKFSPTGKEVSPQGNLEIVSFKEALKSPLVKSIFTIEGVKSVYLTRDNLSIGKKDEVEWDDLKNLIIDKIENFYDSGAELFYEVIDIPEENQILDTDSEVVKLIKEILETRVRPVVQEDGGDIIFRSFDESSGIVILSMRGSCTGCPSSSITLKSGIERMLKHYVAEVKEVEAYDG